MDEDIQAGMRLQVVGGDIEFVQIFGREAGGGEVMDGPARLFEGMDVEEAGVVVLRKLREPGQQPPTVGEGGVDEAQIGTFRLQHFDALEHFAECVGVITHFVVFGFAAIDADGNEIEGSEDGAFGGRGQKHRVCRHRVEIAELFCGLGEGAKMGIKKGFAAGEADDVIAEGCGLFKKVEDRV